MARAVASSATASPCHGDVVVTLDQVTVEARDNWRSWLEQHHDSSPGVWLVRWKKDSGHRHLTSNELVAEALCFGWVDSQPRMLDKQRSQLRVGPRKPGSNWSGPNKERVERMVGAGLMQPAGLAAVQRAQSDGTWTALDAVEKLVEPNDLKTLLDRDKSARSHWDDLPPSARARDLGVARHGTHRRDQTSTTRAHRLRCHEGIRASQ